MEKDSPSINLNTPKRKAIENKMSRREFPPTFEFVLKEINHGFCK